MDVNSPIIRKQRLSKYSSHRFNIGRGVGFFIGQRAEEKKEVRRKHTDMIYNQIVGLLGESLDFEVPLGDWLSCLDPDAFPKEHSSHLEAYSVLRIATNAKELCKNFNTDLEKTINDTIKEFVELVEKLAEKECAEGKKFSLQRYDIFPHPRSFYSPSILAWDIYHNARQFQPYIVETIDGRFKIGNTVAEGNSREEMESFAQFVNQYCLTKLELFRNFHDERQKTMKKVGDFVDALREIKKKLDSGHRLAGHCYLCREP